MDTLLHLLKQNARLTSSELASILDVTAGEVEEQIKEYERTGIINGYSAIIDEEAADQDSVTAFIELKVTPQPNFGFDDIASTIMQFDEVDSVYLLSGEYDLSVTISGRNLRDIALFVAQRLAPLNGVLATSTHFVLRRYKERGIFLMKEDTDERGLISL
ncbi:MAG: Lrp/AsnC family transcriptional regulator [Clostridiales bacterium]|nr:Lrp/AsnC family transcriptional regulator [Clostridiales bacterium]